MYIDLVVCPFQSTQLVESYVMKMECTSTLRTAAINTR